MPGGRRGLVAPQNTFLDTLIKKASAQGGDTGFLLCNAQIVDFPVVFCSEEFSKLLGFPRSEVMQNSIRSDFMVGALSEKSTIGKYSRLSIKCVGWNKHVGWKFFEDQIKVLDGISMLVGKCLDNH